MDNFENQRITFENIDDAILLFDEIFCDIAPIKKNNKNGQVGTSKSTISRSVLTARQCESIKHLSGFLQTAKEATDMIRYYKEEKVLNDLEKKVMFLDSMIDEKNRAEKRDAKRISAVREYLIKELNRSDSLEKMLQIKESELVLITAEKSKLEKILQKNSHPELENNFQKVPDIKDIVPKDMIGRFVRKPFGKDHFFGIVSSFSAPFFKIVYEDTDEEEMTLSELMKNLWAHQVPSAKMMQCQKHASKSREEDGSLNANDDDAELPSQTKQLVTQSVERHKRRASSLSPVPVPASAAPATSLAPSLPIVVDLSLELDGQTTQSSPPKQAFSAVESSAASVVSRSSSTTSITSSSSDSDSSYGV